MTNDKVFIICGPTASGKTALAVRLAGDRPASIISADSRQVFKGLDVITGKDIPIGSVQRTSTVRYDNHDTDYFEKDNLRFWGTDLIQPNEVFNAGEFADYTRRVIINEINEGRKVFVVGGTGFYLKALTNPGSVSKILPNEALRKELDSLSVEDLAQKLWEINPQRFVQMNQSDSNNPRRLIRAIEVESAGASHTSNSESVTEIEFNWIGIRPTLEQLHERIRARVVDRLNTGAVDEVKTLMQNFPDTTLPIYSTLGVGPIQKHLASEINRTELEDAWLLDEMNYAKRQITWFKKQDDIVWYDLDKITKINNT